eukprot:scaffold22290_cov101-Isochrysis_galbana.AAC.3
MQRLSKAAVVFDAKAIKKGAISLKQQACHVRPSAVMGAMAAANAVRGGGREGALKAPLLVFSPLAGASSWGVLCRGLRRGGLRASLLGQAKASPSLSLGGMHARWSVWGGCDVPRGGIGEWRKDLGEACSAGCADERDSLL